MPRTRRLVFELLTQVGHINPDVMRPLRVAGSPNITQQLPVSEDLPLAADERCKKPKLDRRKVDDFT